MRKENNDKKMAKKEVKNIKMKLVRNVGWLMMRNDDGVRCDGDDD